MVETLLDEESDDSIGVEEEIAATGLLVADDGVKRLELGSLREGEYRRGEGGGRRLGRGRVLEDHVASGVVSCLIEKSEGEW